MPLGEEGTEQFSIEVKVDGKIVDRHPIHDPFITARVNTRRGLFNRIVDVFLDRPIRFVVRVGGSQGAISAVMSLDPKGLEADSNRRAAAYGEAFGIGALAK